jgi:hypothetical protein
MYRAGVSTVRLFRTEAYVAPCRLQPNEDIVLQHPRYCYLPRSALESLPHTRSQFSILPPLLDISSSPVLNTYRIDPLTHILKGHLVFRGLVQ